ncbi:MAG TPA: M48 family metallopeptidase [Candidatus Kryptonia bacterium]|nr:M48 family metallopeptidase [Candidatus Kryptonia bacterium]
MTRVVPSAAVDFRGLVTRWAAQIGVHPKRVQLQRMTKKWASCSTSGRVCFSTDLLAEERAFQEMVIVHELLHLQIPNHGKLFKGLMSAYLPQWEHIARGRVARLCAFQTADNRA